MITFINILCVCINVQDVESNITLEEMKTFLKYVH
jgi:hypothetical protein